ncbi:hypothetical protein RRF57_011252 [Xylaria bambusicola]|uniref:Uncharacterized protein n=1 Tax=Xylaria bambusicola TaxID=326684 RepID=A0AAN7Z3H1_9PEZI
MTLDMTHKAAQILVELVELVIIAVVGAAKKAIFASISIFDMGISDSSPNIHHLSTQRLDLIVESLMLAYKIPATGIATSSHVLSVKFDAWKGEAAF